MKLRTIQISFALSMLVLMSTTTPVFGQKTASGPTLFDQGTGYNPNSFTDSSIPLGEGVPDATGPALGGDLVQTAGDVSGSGTQYAQDAGSIGTQTTFSTNVVSLGTCPAISYSSLKNLVAYLICLINKFLVPILATLALVLFVWGIVQYVVNADNEEAREQGKKVILWGIIGLFSMVGVWGLVSLLISTLGFN